MTSNIALNAFNGVISSHHLYPVFIIITYTLKIWKNQIDSKANHIDCNDGDLLHKTFFNIPKS